MAKIEPCSEMTLHIMDALSDLAAEKGITTEQAIPLLHADHPTLSKLFLQDTVSAVFRASLDDGDARDEYVAFIKRYGDKKERAAADKLGKTADSMPDPKGTIKMNAEQMAGLTNDMKDIENYTKLSKQVVKLARAINKADPTITLDNLVVELQKELDQFVEGAISREDIQKLVYGYGITTKPNGSAEAKNWRLLREQAGLLSKLTDLRKEIIPPKTGQQRESLSDDGRTLSAEVNQLLGKDLKHEDIDKELKTQNDRLKTLLENSIADIEKANANNAKLKERPTKFVINEENKILREKLAVLRKAYHVRTGTVDAKKLQAAMKAAQRSIDTLQAKLNDEYDPPSKTPLEPTQELTDIRAEMKRLRDQYLASEYAPSVKEARKRKAELKRHKEAGTLPPKPGESEAKNAHTAKLKEEIADLRKAIRESDAGQKEKKLEQIDRLEERIANADFVPRARTEKIRTSGELLDLDFKLDELKIDAHRMIESMRPKTLWDNFADFGVAVRWGVAGGEWSMIMRQAGAYAMAHPIGALKAIREDNMAAYHSRKGAYKAYMKLQRRPNAWQDRLSGLVILREDSPRMKGEEMLASRFIGEAGKWFSEGKGKHIPVAKQYMGHMEATARSYNAYLNRVRVDWYDLLIQHVENPGSPTVEEMKKVAKAVNILTGRGGEGMPMFEKAVQLFNVGFFAPRYQMSRLQILLAPVMAASRTVVSGVDMVSPKAGEYLGYVGLKGWNKLDAKISGIMLKEAGKIGAGGMAIMGLLAAACHTFLDPEDWGFEWEESTSSDYGKLRIGPFRFDMWGGVQQWFVFAKRMTGKYTTAVKTRDGKVIKGSVNTYPIYGEGRPFTGQSPKDIITNKLWSAASPAVGIPLQVIYGENYFGETTHRGKLAAQLVTPLYLSDMIDVLTSDQLNVPTKMASVAAGFLGVGIQKHQEKP